MRRTRLLLLGGSRFVGRAVIVEALARGWDTPLCTGGSLVRCRARWPGCGPTGPSPASWSALGEATWDVAVHQRATAAGVDVDSAAGPPPNPTR